MNKIVTLDKDRCI